MTSTQSTMDLVQARLTVQRVLGIEWALADMDFINRHNASDPFADTSEAGHKAAAERERRRTDKVLA